MLRFQVTARDPTSHARGATLTLPHGVVRTPAFLPIGTRAAVKGILPDQVRESGSEIILANAYHLAQRPGAEVVAEFGGLHRFMGWDGPILTDSGGYQVFSLSDLTKITDEGVTFRSHLDGRYLHFDPFSAIAIQNRLGADIIMALDQCPPGNADYALASQAVERTVHWAQQCRQAHQRTDQALLAVVQGGVYHDLRASCAGRLVDMDFPGYAVGGLSVGETREQMVEVLEHLVPALPAERPRYLMGVGMPRDILAAVRAGIDMFDCVLPTRNGRNACAFTARGTLKLRNEQFRRQQGPLEEGCPCPACRKFSRAYIRHLFVVKEMLGSILVSMHNLWFFQRFMARLRDLIPGGDWATMLAEFPIAASGRGEARPA